MYNYKSNINQLKNDSFLDLPYNEIQKQYAIENTIFHLTKRLQAILSTVEAEELLETISNCEKLLPFEQYEQMQFLQIWLIDSNSNNNITTLTCGSLTHKLNQFEVNNFSITLPKLAIMITPLLHAEKSGRLVFLANESKTIRNSIEEIIERVTKQN